MITMSDIAAKAGVSRSTVSFVLNGRQDDNVRIPEATRQRILEATNELGYRPNQLAQSVASGKTRMIGYLVEEPRYEPYWATIIGALAEAEKLGFTLKVLTISTGTLEERLRQCVGLRLSGLIVRYNHNKGTIFEEANRAKIPVVTVDEGIDQPFGSRVAADDVSGCHEALSHLISLGHRKIAFIGSDFPRVNKGGADVGSAREAIFRQQMELEGLELPEAYIQRDSMLVYGEESSDSSESVFSAVDALLTQTEQRPTAIFCWRDETAMLAVRACEARGLRVPDDMSIVGFSDINSSRFFNPPLSTIKTPWELMGRQAVTELLDRLNGDFNPEPKSIFLPTTFVARQSSGPVSDNI